MPPFRHFRLETDEAGVTVWIDVAGRSVNVFDNAVLGEFAALIEGLHAAPPPALLLRSAKARGFAAGADLKYLASLADEAAAERFLADGQRALDRLASLPCPTVAVVHGTCLGGGLEVALACRYRSAARDPGTMLGLPESTLGLIPGWGGTLRLPELIGMGPALRLMLTGAPVPAAEALPLGLVNALHDPSDAAPALLAGAASRPAAARDASPGRLDSQASQEELDKARGIYCAAGATGAQEAVLASVVRGITGPRKEALQAERRRCARLLFTPECRERLEAFLNR